MLKELPILFTRWLDSDKCLQIGLVVRTILAILLVASFKMLLGAVTVHLHCEENFVKRGYEEGLLHGETVGHQEGFDLGIKKGKEIGSEIAFYRGFAKGCISSLTGDSDQVIQDRLKQYKDCLDPDSFRSLEAVVHNFFLGRSTSSRDVRPLKTLQKLLDQIQEFPEENLKDQDFADRLRDIRAKFKQCCALQRIETAFSSEHPMNF